MQSSRSRRVLLARTVVASLLLALGIAAMSSGQPSASQRARSSDSIRTSDGSSGRSKIVRALRREQRSPKWDEQAEPTAEAKARCSVANSQTWFSTAEARIMYLDSVEDGELFGPERNRAAGCLYETGRVTEFGFSDVIEGESLSQVTGRGDFVGFVASSWMAADGIDDGFQVWNLRTGARIFRHWCSNQRSDCGIGDIAVSAKGSLAYVACWDYGCALVARRAGHRMRRVFARWPMSAKGSPAILVSEARLYWLNRRGMLRSIAFP